jgi:tryptophan-rich sensory protein
MTYLVAVGICLVAAAVEALCAGPNPMAQLKATRQPSWSPPVWAWAMIGIAWYGICLTALVRLLPAWPDTAVPVILLVILMLANAAANLFQFRLKRLDLAFLYLFPYWGLLAAFLRQVAGSDRLSFGLFAAYAVYQIYAAAWAYRLWKLNPRR